MITIALLALVMTGCVKPIPEVITLNGRAVDESSNTIQGANVSVVCDATTYASCVTGADGRFSLDFNINKLGSNNILSIYTDEKVGVCELKGIIGESEFDFNDVVLKTLKVFTVWNGYTYQAYPTDLGPATWDEANRFSNDLVFVGHDDWRLPDLDALYAMKGFLMGTRYWSRTGKDGYVKPHYYYVDVTTETYGVESADKEYYYRPVRLKH